MAINIFEQYGLKEVADVILYDITTASPVLYLDSLKLSNIEQTASTSDAMGGKGNPKLITWDYGKEITITLQDALMSMKSLQLLVGGAAKAHTTVQKIKKAELVKLGTAGAIATKYTAVGNIFILDTAEKITAGTTQASTVGSAGDIVRVVYEANSTTTGAYEIVITPNTFPGTYMLVGDTVIRNKKTGLDEGFQFIIPKAKIGAELTLTMEAEGDPTAFDMTLTVLKADNGTMMSLVKYDIGSEVAGAFMSNL